MRIDFGNVQSFIKLFWDMQINDADHKRGNFFILEVPTTNYPCKALLIFLFWVGGEVEAKSSQVPDMFPKEFSIAPYFYPICFGKCYPPCTYISVWPVPKAQMLHGLN
jgi:hypothetical protein